MSHPAVVVNPGEVHWFPPHLPKALVGDCPHDCRHYIRTTVAWGPSEELYDLQECELCHCRGWRPWAPKGVITAAEDIRFQLAVKDLPVPFPLKF